MSHEYQIDIDLPPDVVSKKLDYRTDFVPYFRTTPKNNNDFWGRVKKNHFSLSLTTSIDRVVAVGDIEPRGKGSRLRLRIRRAYSGHFFWLAVGFTPINELVFGRPFGRPSWWAATGLLVILVGCAFTRKVLPRECDELIAKIKLVLNREEPVSPLSGSLEMKRKPVNMAQIAN